MESNKYSSIFIIGTYAYTDYDHLILNLLHWKFKRHDTLYTRAKNKTHEKNFIHPHARYKHSIFWPGGLFR